jgi:hypothetical protein
MVSSGFVFPDLIPAIILLRVARSTMSATI